MQRVTTLSRIAFLFGITSMLLLGGCGGNGSTSRSSVGLQTPVPATMTPDMSLTPTGTTLATVVPTTTASPSTPVPPTAGTTNAVALIRGNTLYVMDAGTGVVRGTQVLSSNVNYGVRPVIANKLVYVPADPNYLEAFNAKTGARVWKSTVVEEGTPLVAGSLVYAETFAGVTGNYMVSAVNALTGAVVWQHSASAWSNTALFVSDGILYVQGSLTSSGPVLTTFNAITGTPGPIYHLPSMSSVISGIDNGVVYYACEYTKACAVKIATGTVLWRSAAGGGEGCDTAFANGIVYFGSPNSNGLYAVSAATGQLLFHVGLTAGIVQAKPLLYNGNVYVATASSNHPYYAVNATTGATVWSYQSLGVGSTGKVYQGLIYLNGGTGTVTVNPATGGIHVISSLFSPYMDVGAW